MAESLPLPALLSGALVACTIELDNEFEHGFEHRSATRRARGERLRGPWLTSAVMWANCVRYVSEEGITVGELKRQARTHTNLDGIRRWGYVTVDGYGRGPASGFKRPGPASVLRLTASGRRARDRWDPLPDQIEARWRQRFGGPEVDRLRTALGEGFVTRLTGELPDCLPILGFGLFCARGDDRPAQGPPASATDAAELSLWSLLSRALLAFALDYEQGTKLSLAVMADVVRVLNGSGVVVADLPRISGVSKEAIAMALARLETDHLVEVTAENRRRVARLTDRGAEGRRRGLKRIASVECSWHERFGAGAVNELRGALEPLVGDLTRQGSPLFLGLDPHDDGWRAQTRRPETLPWFPMVLHRGGWPDGS